MVKIEKDGTIIKIKPGEYQYTILMALIGSSKNIQWVKKQMESFFKACQTKGVILNYESQIGSNPFALKNPKAKIEVNEAGEEIEVPKKRRATAKKKIKKRVMKRKV